MLSKKPGNMAKMHAVNNIMPTLFCKDRKKYINIFFMFEDQTESLTPPVALLFMFTSVYCYQLKFHNFP
jgi:hypothetical protein